MGWLFNFLTSGKAILLYEVIILGALIIYLVNRSNKKKAEQERMNVKLAQERSEKLDKLLKNPEWEGNGNNYSDPYEVKYLDHYGAESPDSGKQLEIAVQSKTSIKKYVFDTSNPITIGRSQENTLWIEDRMVSRKHCIIYPEGNVLYVKDLNAMNHTKLIRGSREKVLGDNPAAIKDKDILEVGAVNLTLTYLH